MTEETKTETENENWNGDVTSHMVARWYRPPEIILAQPVYDT